MNASAYGRLAPSKGFLKHTEDKEFLKYFKGFNPEDKYRAISTWYMAWHLAANIVQGNILGYALQWATKENAAEVFTALLNASYMAEAEYYTQLETASAYQNYHDFSEAAWIIRYKFNLPDPS